MPSACPEHFFENQAPDLLNPKLTAETTELCFSAFSAEHSGITRTPLWSAEHLTAARILAARQLPRKGCRFRRKPATYSNLMAATIPI
jgi:endonuclease G